VPHRPHADRGEDAERRRRTDRTGRTEPATRTVRAVRTELEEEGRPVVTSRRRDDAEEREGPVIRDRRRIDPATGVVREPAEKPPSGASRPGKHRAPEGKEAATEAAAQPAADDETGRLTTQLAERTADVQRIQAEYANYRKRVDRDRVAVREQALANVLGELVPVLDDIGRAREHEELTGGFKSVAESIEAIVGKLGLEQFGERGDAFDPNVHEALTHAYSSEVDQPTCVEIFQPGYSAAGRILRPARVAVAEPAEEEAGQESTRPAN
jgi:molecular chaperone GrpE